MPAISRNTTEIVISLGDSFHDRERLAPMPDLFRDGTDRLMAGREWIWIAGNHDPDAPRACPARP